MFFFHIIFPVWKNGDFSINSKVTESTDSHTKLSEICLQTFVMLAILDQFDVTELCQTCRIKAVIALTICMLQRKPKYIHVYFRTLKK